MISPSATLYCLPPVAIIAYIWHLLLSLLANYGVCRADLKTSLCGILIYYNIWFFIKSIGFFRFFQFFITVLDNAPAGNDSNEFVLVVHHRYKILIHCLLDQIFHIIVL